VKASDDDLCLRSATELAALVRSRELSARELLDAHLDRIERINPTINAIVTIDVDGARRAARAADAALVAGEHIGPLHGLPVAHKDTHATAAMRTTWGSPLHASDVPAEDELVVARLVAAGAVRVGKTNVPEFAVGSHTVNSLFGATHNPYRHGLSAGGSSGGAAAALAAGLVAVAEGADMGGSLRNPAAFCNVVGLRPTPGRVPSWPTTMGWSQLQVQGPMGRTVSDVALQLSVLAEPDRRVPIALSDDQGLFAAPLTLGVSGLRVAWAPDLGGAVPVEPVIVEVLERAVRVFDDLGAGVEFDCPDLSEADEVFRVLRAWSFLASFGEQVRCSPEQFKETIRWNTERGFALTAADLAAAEMAHTRLYETMVAFFDRYDVLLCPTTQVVPFPVEIEYPTEVAGVEQSDYLGWMRSCTLISPTGCPALSVPGGFTPDGLPVGLQIVGPPRAERLVLEVGHAFEQATRHGWRRPPPEELVRLPSLSAGSDQAEDARPVPRARGLSGFS
jgi:amidase